MTKDYSPEAKAEFAKPAVSIERVGTDAEAAREWEAAAHKQAKRAEWFKSELSRLRDQLDAILAADENLENE